VKVIYFQLSVPLKSEDRGQNNQQTSSEEAENRSSVEVDWVVVGVVTSLVRTALVTGSAVRVIEALNTYLFAGGTSGSWFTAVVVEQAFYALFLGQRASRSSGRTVRISFAGEWEDASGIGTAFGSSSFSSSPVVKGAVGIRSTFYTTTSFQVTVRSTIIGTIVIGSTEVNANVGERIAVRLVRSFSSIDNSTFVSRWLKSTGIATSITSTVRSSSRAISIDITRSASTIREASRLVGG